jgi:hypothetical protein
VSNVLTDYPCAPLVLRDACLAFIKATFGTQLATVDSYGGSFSEAEITAKSFLSPAVHLAVLGWHPIEGGRRLAGRHAWRVYMAAFVTVKSIDREMRGDQAVRYASALADVLRTWHPSGSAHGVQIGALDQDAECENLYSRKADEMGVARWLVRWDQEVQSTVRFAPMPLYPLTHVDMTNTVEGAPAVPSGSVVPPMVTDEIAFNQLNPAYLG